MSARLLLRAALIVAVVLAAAGCGSTPPAAPPPPNTPEAATTWQARGSAWFTITGPEAHVTGRGSLTPDGPARLRITFRDGSTWDVRVDADKAFLRTPDGWTPLDSEAVLALTPGRWLEPALRVGAVTRDEHGRPVRIVVGHATYELADFTGSGS